MTVFTGAGCSVEPPSSIPDFRSPGGLWSRYDPAVYCEYNTFVGQPHLFWEMATELTRDIHAINGGTQEELLETGTVRHARPNAAHVAIADLERLGCVTACITQNIDGLHGKACFFPPPFPLSLHVSRTRCARCGPSGGLLLRHRASRASDVDIRRRREPNSLVLGILPVGGRARRHAWRAAPAAKPRPRSSRSGSPGSRRRPRQRLALRFRVSLVVQVPDCNRRRARAAPSCPLATALDARFLFPD